jgi:hypothetical protein
MQSCVIRLKFVTLDKFICMYTIPQRVECIVRRKGEASVSNAESSYLCYLPFFDELCNGSRKVAHFDW